MPNHVSNVVRIEATGNRLAEIREFLTSTDDKGNTCHFDFKNILPTPKGLPQGSSPFRSSYTPKDVEALVKTGFEDWYPWNTNNYGTKWGAYATEERSADTVYFETAWSHPVEVIRALSLIFRDVPFHVMWADEDTGSNLGSYDIKHGVLTPGDFPPPGTKAATLFALRTVRGLSEADIKERADEEAEYALEQTQAELDEEAAQAEVRLRRVLCEINPQAYPLIRGYVEEGNLADVYRISCWRANLFNSHNQYSSADPVFVRKAVRDLQHAGILTAELEIDAAMLAKSGLE